MTSDTRSPEEIEREIERERAELSGTLETLQDRFSVEGVARQVSDQFREHGGDLGRSVTRAVKDNPVALVVTGIGLAWLMFGNNSDSRTRNASFERSRDYGSGDDYDARQRVFRSDDPYRAYPSTPPARRSPTWIHADNDLDDRDWDDDDGPSMGERLSSAGSSASQSARKTGSAAKGHLSSASGKVQNSARNAGNAVRDAGASAQDSIAASRDHVATRASEMRDGASRRAAALRERLAEGTENFSDEARARVVAARESAMTAKRQAGRHLTNASDATADYYDRQPLVAGALAMAVGAAIGSALPGTRREDELMGRHRDDLVDEAERIFHQEREKAEAVVKAGMDEAKSVVEDTKKAADDKTATGKTPAEAVKDDAKSKGQRVVDAAKSEADRKKLGDPTS